MNNDKWKSLLGLCNRAGKCISGEELVVREVRRNKAYLVLLSKDASKNTQKKLTDKCNTYSVPICYVEDRESLGHAIGKEARVVVAIMEKGFANKIQQLLA